MSERVPDRDQFYWDYVSETTTEVFRDTPWDKGRKYFYKLEDVLAPYEGGDVVYYAHQIKPFAHKWRPRPRIITMHADYHLKKLRDAGSLPVEARHLITYDPDVQVIHVQQQVTKGFPDALRERYPLFAETPDVGKLQPVTVTENDFTLLATMLTHIRRGLEEPERIMEMAKAARPIVAEEN